MLMMACTFSDVDGNFSFLTASKNGLDCFFLFPPIGRHVKFDVDVNNSVGDVKVLTWTASI